MPQPVITAIQGIDALPTQMAQRVVPALDVRCRRHLPVMAFREDIRQPDHRRPATPVLALLPMPRAMPVAHRHKALGGISWERLATDRAWTSWERGLPGTLRLVGLRVQRVEHSEWRIADFTLVRETPVIEVYVNTTEPQHTAVLAAPWSSLPWHLIVLMEAAVQRGWAAFSAEPVAVVRGGRRAPGVSGPELSLGIGSYDHYALPHRAYITQVVPRVHSLEVWAEVERVERFLRTYEIVWEPLRVPAGARQQGEIPLCRYVVISPDGTVAQTSAAPYVGDDVFRVELRGDLAPGLYTILLALYLNENAVAPEIKTVMYSVPS